MRDASGKRGYLLVRQFTDTGQTIPPPPQRGWSLSAWSVSVRDRILNRFGEAGSEPPTFQIQLLVTGDVPLDEGRQGLARESFQLAVEQLVVRLWPNAAPQAQPNPKSEIRTAKQIRNGELE
jgi:hypothetical protein